MTATRVLPAGNIQRNVLLKALVGVFAGSVLFAVYAYAYSSFQPGLGLPGYEVGLLMIVLGVLFALLPAMVGTYLLLAWVYREFRHGRASGPRSLSAGLAVGFLAGVFAAFCGLGGLLASPATAGIVVMAALVGGWVGIQAFSEIKTCEGNER